MELQFGAHPYGIRPLGDSVGIDCNCRNGGLGQLSVLSDEVMIELLQYCPVHALNLFSAVSLAAYAFANYEELWRDLVIRKTKGDFGFRRDWKTTYVGLSRHTVRTDTWERRLRLRNFYSDYLFQAWYCASVCVADEWVCRQNIDRREGLSRERFVDEYELPNRPVIITDVVREWPAFTKWTDEYLLETCGSYRFAAAAARMSMSQYLQYAQQTREERPLYLFDHQFGEEVPQLAADYSVPTYFSEDLFSVLGDDRPNYRWLIVGPARSGSSFHIDPNSTSAWNAVVRGRKKWILYPPNVVPPGIFASADGAEVASPVSLTDWFLTHYETTSKGPQPFEAICEAGELIFVPRGWWHLVINLEDSVAITQNYVSSQNLPQVGKTGRAPWRLRARVCRALVVGSHCDVCWCLLATTFAIGR
jgi:hypothetical protein